MKDLFWIFIFFIIILYFFGEGKLSDNVDYESTSIDSLSDTFSIQQEKFVKYPFDYVVVKSLGETEEHRLVLACQYITDYFGCDCFIQSGENIGEEMKIENTDDILDCDTTLQLLWQNHRNSQYRTIFITDKLLWSKGQRLRGMTYYGESVILVCASDDFLRETILHEMGHTLNLKHCQDSTCIMSVNNDEWDSGDFCKNCKNYLLQIWN